MWFDTRRVILTAGAASANRPLVAFDMALRKAGIADFNLIKVTSIVPPGVPVMTLPEGSTPVLGQGAMVPTIYRDLAGDEEGQSIVAGVGVGIPTQEPPEAGLVYVWSGEGVEADARAALTEMVNDGMSARGTTRFETKTAIAAMAVQPPTTSVVAAAIFCDRHIEQLFRPGDVRQS